MTETSPCVVTGIDAEAQALQPLPTDNTLFKEAWLQKLLFKHPSLLPVGELDEAFTPAISIGREIANIDNLFISPSGLLTIVETKLWRNPEAHRTVVAQILEYAKTLAEWDYRTLDEAVKNYTERRVQERRSIFDLVTAQVPELETNEVEFEQSVQECLNNGRFALLIVGDRVHPAATQLAEIIQSAPHLQFTLGFAELKCYRQEEESDWPLIVVPSIVARTKEVTRAVVKVVYEEKRPDIEVSAIEPKRAASPGSTSFEEFVAQLPSDISDLFRTYINRWMETGYTVCWRTVGFSLRIPWEEKFTTVFEAQPGHLSIFQKKRVMKHNLPAEQHQEYQQALMESRTLSSAFAGDWRYIKYEDMSEDEVQLLLESTDRLAAGWFKAEQERRE